MTEFRKHALFQLAVVGLAAVAVAMTYAVTGNAMASLAGFSTLALLPLRPMFLKGSKLSPIQDERDETVQHRATLVGYTALWLALVAWGVAVPLVFGDRGAVPLVWVAPVVWVAWWLVACVRSIAILVLDSQGA